MARISGKAGSVDTGSGAIAGIKTWTIDYKIAALDDTGFDSSGVKMFIPGLSEWNGTFDGFKDGAPIALGSVATLTLKESQTAGQVATGACIITSWKPKVDVAGVVTYVYDFQGTGTLTVPTA